ncbi:MAG: serine protein kinase RIO [Archaeoglobaceae archaeon]
MKEDKIRRIDNYLDKLRIKEKDLDQRKIYSEVLDERTLKLLYKLSSKGVIKALGGIINSGKEASIFFADGVYGEKELPVAVKIYRIETGEFRRMDDYLYGDKRFDVKKLSRKDLIYLWTKKEFKNLSRALKANVRVPEPITSAGNILLIEFLGEEETPAPVLFELGREVENIVDPQELFEDVIENVKKLYQNARLVHADLSEFNIMLFNEKPYLIDMGQSVLIDHPNSMHYLQRDIKNVLRFFSKMGVEEDEQELINRIKGE